MTRRPLGGGPVGVPYLTCRACGRALSPWVADCDACSRLRAATATPVVGEKFRDVLIARRIEGED